MPVCFLVMCHNSCQTFKKLEISCQDVIKNSNVKFRKNLCVGRFHTGGHDNSNGRLLIFREGA
jgi:hypothetical protein